ncbi:MAG: PAS domain S-box protein [bacterium]|nr:PAS domain S-box protein [bacterium]
MPGRRILIVEDELIVAKDIAKSLLAFGYDTADILNSGEKVLARMEALKPDCILMDIMLAGEIDGIETTEQVQKQRDIPVIYITAYNTKEIFERAKKTKAYGFLIKPVEKSSLYAAIETALRQHDLERDGERDEELYRDIVESQAELIARWNPGGFYTFVNSSFQRFFCITTGDELHDSFPPGLCDSDINQYAKLLETFTPDNTLMEFECKYQKEEDLFRWLHFKNRGFFNQDKDLIEVQSVGRDITEMKLAQELIQHKEEKLKAILHHSPNSITVTDLNGIIVECNPITAQMHGYLSMDDVIGKKAFEFISPKDHERAVNNMKKTLLDGVVMNIEYTLLKKDGTEFPGELSASVMRDTAGKPTAFVANVADISERKRTEQALRKSEERFRTMFEGAKDGILLTNLETENFSFANNTICKMLGYSRDELASMTVANIHPEESVSYIRNLFRRMTNDELGIIANIPCKRKDNTIFYAEITSQRIQFGDEDYLAGTFRDMTERKNLEENLFKAKIAADSANRAKSKFLANMSHELRTPLNGIIGFCQILEKPRTGPLNEKQKEFLNYVKESGNHLLEMVNDILDLSKIEAGRVEIEKRSFDFGKMLKRSPSTVKSIAHKKGIDMDIAIDPDIGWLVGDEVRIKQVIYNLLSNAIKFSIPGKQIGIEAKGVDSVIEVTIWDEGTGIPENYLNRIFDPFEQVKNEGTANTEGTGLGLSISKRLIELHNGAIYVTSKLGEGSAFTISLPGRIRVEKDYPEKEDNQGVDTCTEAMYNKTILVVEDNEANIKLIQAALEPLCFRLDYALSGEEAVELALERQYDIVLLDIQLPGIDGIEVMRRIRTLNRGKLPIVAMTSFAMKGDKEKFLYQGFDDYISNPVDLDLLNNVIRKYL